MESLSKKPTIEWMPICGNGAKANFERKSKLDEGVEFDSIKGKEDSSNMT